MNTINNINTFLVVNIFVRSLNILRPPKILLIEGKEREREETLTFLISFGSGGLGSARRHASPRGQFPRLFAEQENILPLGSAIHQTASKSSVTKFNIYPLSGYKSHEIVRPNNTQPRFPIIAAEYSDRWFFEAA